MPVTGVQTCALPISLRLRLVTGQAADPALAWPWWLLALPPVLAVVAGAVAGLQAERRRPLGQVMRIGG